MPIAEEPFSDEKELDQWVAANYKQFFGDAIFIPGFRISTRRDKGGVPDGFVLDLLNSTWTIIEAELIKHGVWDHIAEQIVRFVVASRNDNALQLIRDRFFDAIEASGQIENLSTKLGISPTRLMQRIENIVDGNTPDIAIFIDEVNEDLQDMAAALNTPVRIFRVKKLRVNGQIELYSPDGSKTTFETSVDEVTDSRGNHQRAIDAFGGGDLITRKHGVGIYRLNSGPTVTTKYSKFYPRENSYWYGITPGALDAWKVANVTEVVFIMGDDGAVRVPIALLKEFFKTAYVTKNLDGTVRHYHAYIKPPPNPKLYSSDGKASFDLTSQFVAF